MPKLTAIDYPYFCSLSLYIYQLIHRHLRSYKILFLLSILVIAGCNNSSETQDIYKPGVITISPSAESPSVTPTPETLQPPFSIWIHPGLPSSLSELVSGQDIFNLSHQPENAVIHILATNEDIIDFYVYVLAVPFPSLLEEYQTEDLLNIWRFGKPENINLYLSPETKNSLTILWGEPAKDNIRLINPEKLLAEIWNDHDAIAIIPFEDIHPRYKILAVDNQHPLDVDFSPSSYPLSLPLSLKITANAAITEIDLDLSNYSRSKLTSVALTGVTAMVRDTAATMEEKGITYPAADIKSILLNADITHISNEVPFASDCPAPDPDQPSLYFCSSDEYIQLLEEIGTDIVELSGDHFGDWGPEAMLHSLDLYHQRDWLTYGGGETLQAGLDPVLIEHNNNRIAFIGCNGKVHDTYATAAENNPGASRCDFEWMLPEITRLSDEGYSVIATMQHEEVDSFYSIAIQQYDFRRLAEAGATIVSGSQAHHPQAVEFLGSSFIHYGLGNLFFDQWYLATRNPEVHEFKDKAFIDIHYFYNGSYINSRLVPLQFIDNARPRLMTNDEAVDFLGRIYKASVWNIPAD